MALKKMVTRFEEYTPRKDDEPNVPLSLRVPLSVLVKIDMLAERWNLSRSSAAAEIMEAAVPEAYDSVVEASNLTLTDEGEFTDPEFWQLQEEFPSHDSFIVNRFSSSYRDRYARALESLETGSDLARVNRQ